MSYILFVDESGHDRKASPYEVLAGVAIEDRDLWNLVTALAQTEEEIFGRRYSDGHRELKAKRLLKSKTFRLARQQPSLALESRRALARAALDDGAGASGDELIVRFETWMTTRTSAFGVTPSSTTFARRSGKMPRKGKSQCAFTRKASVRRLSHAESFVKLGEGVRERLRSLQELN